MIITTVEKNIMRAVIAIINSCQKLNWSSFKIFDTLSRLLTTLFILFVCLLLKLYNIYY